MIQKPSWAPSLRANPSMSSLGSRRSILASRLHTAGWLTVRVRSKPHACPTAATRNMWCLPGISRMAKTANDVTAETLAAA